ncbi:hypothetical protein EK21DRAFT_90063 [Setomelanomma holmii]|uniref:Uncharacterized protein n=1 Tax=Setomelanomma holmii TaxID=210430 RepID=A0A9P4H6S6_9PLEO|nr:hypothetical protein EK21DRAFT_90063 [Setomelanomma holmii]
MASQRIFTGPARLSRSSRSCFTVLPPRIQATMLVVKAAWLKMDGNYTRHNCKAALGIEHTSRVDTHPVCREKAWWESDPGATLCGTYGLLQYCARVGYKCCDTMHIAPLSATCCSGGSYAPVGNYCCTNGRNCPNGKSCTGCTPTDGNGGFIGSSLPAVSSATIPAITTTTKVTTVYTYFYFTITYYYYHVYWVYVPSITRSTPTSSTVTVTTTVSVYAANSADAASSFSALSATISSPMPASATVLPSISQPSIAVSSPTTTNSARSAGSVSSAPPGATQSQFAGSGNRPVDGRSYSSSVAWGVVLAVGFKKEANVPQDWNSVDE